MSAKYGTDTYSLRKSTQNKVAEHIDCLQVGNEKNNTDDDLPSQHVLLGSGSCDAKKVPS
jgi:hypothetical protein